MSRQSHLDAVHSIVLGTALSRTMTDAQARYLKRFGERHREWWGHENVVGLCIARKRRNGGFGHACVQVLVEKKLPGHKLDKRHKIPEKLVCPAFSRELLTDVRAVGKARLEALVTATRPARPGYNLGNELGGSGTLSCIVKERTTGKRLGLSCAHVIAPEGASSVGAAVGGAVYCPSLANAEDMDVLSEAPIGTLYRVAPLGFDESDAATNVDAAVFEPDAANLLDVRVAQLGASPKGVNNKPTVGLKVHKVGAVSEQTYGTIQAIGLCAKVTYDGAQRATFINQIGITRFAYPGDSGALVLDENGLAIGMHFASFEGMSLCTPISRVLESLDCVLA